MPDPGPATPTWSVAELHDAVNGLLEHVFGDALWVEGEISNLTRSRANHVYFDLVDPATTGSAQRASLGITLFDSDRQAVNRFLVERAGGAVRMTDGIRVRIRGRLRTYPARSSLQLVMDGIDPAFTLGILGQERERLLAALREGGLLRANAGRAVTPLPLRVALITSSGSAAHADVLHELEASGLGFEVLVLDARTQGIEAETSLLAALRTAAALEVDVVAVVRGGGARTDLAAFDSEAVARAIAAHPLPVWTGIGHETDRSVADEVAHTAHKTPTACAAALVNRVRDARLAVHDGWVRVASAAAGRAGRAEQRLDRLGRRCGSAAVRHLDRDRAGVDHLADRAARAGRGTGRLAGRTVDDLARRVAPAAARRLEELSRELVTLEARSRVHDPAAALARGWSITVGPDGRPVRSVGQVAPGAVLVTRVADGSLRSVVEPGQEDHP